MDKDIYLVVVAIIIWSSGYFAPGAVSKIPIDILNTYLILPGWLVGILRKRHSDDIPEKAISTRALGAELSAVFLILLHLGFRFQWPLLDSRLMKVYGAFLCVFIGFMIALLIRKVRPYNL